MENSSSPFYLIEKGSGCGVHLPEADALLMSKTKYESWRLKLKFILLSCMRATGVILTVSNLSLSSENFQI